MLKFVSLSFFAIFVFQLAAVPLTWYRVPNLGSPSATPRFGSLGYFAKNRQLIFYGGFSDKTHICNLTGAAGANLTCDWGEIATTTSPGVRGFTYSGVCESEEVFVVAAGRSSAGENLNDIWFFSFRDQDWHEVSASGPIPAIRYAGGGGVAVNACEFFLTMGFGGDVRSSDSFTMDLRNITATESGEWRLVGPSHTSYDPFNPHARCLNAGTFLNKDTFAIFGGCLNALGESGNGGPCPSWDSWYFNIPSQTWYPLPTCVSPRSFVPMSNLPNSNTSAVLFGGRLDSKVIPTVLAPTPPLDEVAILDLATSEKWFRKGALPDPTYGFPAFRRDHHMITGEGVVFVYGGRTNDSGPSLPDLWYLYGDYKENADLGCPESFFTAEMAHGILMFLAWGVCLQAGFVIARYAKFGNALWFYLHIILQMTGLFLAVFGFILGFLNRSKPVFAHGIIGIIAMGLALWQPINAHFRPELKKGEKDSIFRWIWYFVHMLTGRFALLLGLVNISLGLFLILAPLPVWIIWYVLLFFYLVFLVVMETIYWIRSYRRKNEEKMK